MVFNICYELKSNDYLCKPEKCLKEYYHQAYY